jgi:hypothetical protein
MNEFRYINHTFTHADMDTPHPEYSSCDYDTLTYNQIRAEIADNLTVWAQLGLPEHAENGRILLTGNHAGLKDRNCTDYGEDAQNDDIPYSVGANPDFLLAAQSVGVKYLASDASQLNQDAEQYIPGYDLLLLPRYPTNIFVNAVTPVVLTDAYNYTFYERFINKGLDPCQIPGALCSPRTYNDILAAEADMAVRHMLSYRKWPHFFHQSNLGNYGGSSLMMDWLEVVVSKYEELFTLPILNLPYYQIGDMTRDKLAARAANIQARWDLSTNTVTIETDAPVNNLMITGVENGVIYGGQSIRTLNLTTTPQTLAVDHAWSH